MISEYTKGYMTGSCVTLVVILLAIYGSKAQADVRCTCWLAELEPLLQDKLQ